MFSYAQFPVFGTGGSPPKRPVTWKVSIYRTKVVSFNQMNYRQKDTMCVCEGLISRKPHWLINDKST